MEDDEKDIETVMKQIDQIDNKINFKSFGKTRPRQKKLVANKSKNKTQEDKDIELKQNEDERVEDILS